MNIHNKIKHLSLIPRLGYWTYDKDIDEFYWSKETCILLNWPTPKPQNPKTPIEIYALINGNRLLAA